MADVVLQVSVPQETTGLVCGSKARTYNLVSRRGRSLGVAPSFLEAVLFTSVLVNVSSFFSNTH